MRDGSESIESMLLDLHLKRLDAEQARRVEEALAASPELASQSGAIRELLALLDHADVLEPAGDLADRVMATVDAQMAVIPFEEAASAVPAGTAHDLSAIPVLSLRELIAIAACITLFVGIFVPGYFKAQNIARRNLCRENLRLMAAGMSSYAEANAGYLPYTGYVQGASWLPVPTPGVKRVSATRPLFLLLRGQHVRDARVFICPASPHAVPMLADDYREFSDFAEQANNSYSVQCMNTPKGRRMVDMNNAMVLVGDRNPLFDSRAAHRLSPYEDENANSVAHEQGAGQNAVFVGGQGGWFFQPTIGVNGDNIYRVQGVMHYEGSEVPASATDNYLIP